MLCDAALAMYEDTRFVLTYHPGHENDGVEAEVFAECGANSSVIEIAPPGLTTEALTAVAQASLSQASTCGGQSLWVGVPSAFVVPPVRERGRCRYPADVLPRLPLCCCCCCCSAPYQLTHPASLRYGRSPVFWAAELGQVAALKALVAYGADINLADADGTTPLYQASQSGHVESVKCLASAGASINLVDRTSWTPLLVAAYNGHAEVVRCLVGLGAEIDAATNTGATATFYAAYMGHLDILVKLCNAGADLNKPNAHHQTPLYIAVFSHRTRVAVQLLQCGADPNIPDANGTTPLKSAHDAHDSELVATLMVSSAVAAAAVRRLGGAAAVAHPFPFPFPSPSPSPPLLFPRCAAPTRSASTRRS